MKKVLFILKRKANYSGQSTSAGLSTGLYNSASYVHDMMTELGIESKMVVVIDGNSIDREVHQYRPTHVIIEALWVTPAKFSELIRLHPKVTWIIRLHSELPFLANEGMAFDWLGDYGLPKNIVLAVNAPRMVDEIRNFYQFKGIPENTLQEKVIYLPNYYPPVFNRKKYSVDEFLNVGCFGAIRPLKNQLVQALAAISAAERLGKKLKFHINIGRIEQKGDSVLRNIEGLFSHVYDKGHRLISHEWAERERFLEICKSMDIGMQVSFSETFNIVAADLISQGVPIIGSEEIPWISCFFTANPNDSKEITEKLLLAHKFPKMNIFLNQYFLNNYIDNTRRIWELYFGDCHASEYYSYY